MKTKEKFAAIELRRKGKSFNEISQSLGVAKGTLSLWLRAIEISPRQKEKLSQKSFSSNAIDKRRISRLKNEQLRRNRVIKHAEKEVKKISLAELKLIGTALYWAEGGKRRVRQVCVTNCDPYLIRLMMRFFREICKAPSEKIHGHIHIHSHLASEEAEKYWSRVSGIPRSRFYKTYSKPSIASKGKKNTLPYGTFEISVASTELFLKIMGWIRAIGGAPNFGEN